MAEIVIVMLTCDGVIGPRICGKQAEFTGQDVAEADAAAIADGWAIEDGGRLAFCPKCMRKEKFMVPSWAPPNSEL